MSSTSLSSTSQFLCFKDCLARRLLTRGSSEDTGDSDLDEFVSYLADEVWTYLPLSIQTASPESASSILPADSISPETLPLSTTPSSFTDTLISYGYASDTESSLDFLRIVIKEYITESCAPRPIWSSTRTKECEICEREDIPLTYHHLIPKSTHKKVLKMGWHEEWKINSVAWLCRPCHTAVHSVEPNEVLAKSYYTVDLLLEREDIQKWRKYASKQRFKVKRG